MCATTIGLPFSTHIAGVVGYVCAGVVIALSVGLAGPFFLETAVLVSACLTEPEGLVDRLARCSSTAMVKGDK